MFRIYYEHGQLKVTEAVISHDAPSFSFMHALLNGRIRDEPTSFCTGESGAISNIIDSFHIVTSLSDRSSIEKSIKSYLQMKGQIAY